MMNKVMHSDIQVKHDFKTSAIKCKLALGLINAHFITLFDLYTKVRGCKIVLASEDVK